MNPNIVKKRKKKPAKEAPCYRKLLFMFRSIQRARKQAQVKSALTTRLDEMIRIKNLFWQKS